MLVFQGVKKEDAEAACYGNCNIGDREILPKSKYITQIKAKSSGIINMIDASVIAR